MENASLIAENINKEILPSAQLNSSTEDKNASFVKIAEETTNQLYTDDFLEKLLSTQSNEDSHEVFEDFSLDNFCAATNQVQGREFIGPDNGQLLHSQALKSQMSEFVTFPESVPVYTEQIIPTGDYLVDVVGQNQINGSVLTKTEDFYSNSTVSMIDENQIESFPTLSSKVYSTSETSSIIVTPDENNEEMDVLNPPQYRAIKPKPRFNITWDNSPVLPKQNSPRKTRNKKNR